MPCLGGIPGGGDRTDHATSRVGGGKPIAGRHLEYGRGVSEAYSIEEWSAKATHTRRTQRSHEFINEEQAARAHVVKVLKVVCYDRGISAK
jgi:hypothetical protein